MRNWRKICEKQGNGQGGLRVNKSVQTSDIWTLKARSNKAGEQELFDLNGIFANVESG